MNNNNLALAAQGLAALLPDDATLSVSWRMGNRRVQATVGLLPEIPRHATTIDVQPVLEAPTASAGQARPAFLTPSQAFGFESAE